MKSSDESYNEICNKGNEIHKVMEGKTGENYILRKKIYLKIIIYIFKSTKFKGGYDVDRITNRIINTRQNVQ
jgi:hypothetical protein